MKRCAQALVGALLALAPAGARAESLVCAGVLGNSGEQGRDLVRCAPAPAHGMGVVRDRFGTLWDRAGAGTLERYAADGRMLAQYRIPTGNDRRGQLTLVGDTLLLLLGGRLHSPAITAPPGAAATPLAVTATCLPPSAYQGGVVVASADGVARYDVAAGALRPLAALTGVEWVECGQDGAAYAVADLVGSAVYRSGERSVLLTIDAAGAGRAFAVDAAERFRGDLDAVELSTASPVAAWTSLAMQGADTLLAAGDGAVLEFARAGDGWRERRRWRAWSDAPDGNFGAAITIAADPRTLVIADTARLRVLCFALAGTGQGAAPRRRARSSAPATRRAATSPP